MRRLVTTAFAALIVVSLSFAPAIASPTASQGPAVDAAGSETDGSSPAPTGAEAQQTSSVGDSDVSTPEANKVVVDLPDADKGASGDASASNDGQQAADDASSADAQADSAPADADESDGEAASVSLFSLKSLSASKAITTVGGSDRYETSALQALDGWSSSEWVIVASGEGYADSICSAGLAGALNCPIILTAKASLPDSARNAISRLGVKHVIVLGGTAVVSDSVVSQLKELSGNSVTRLAGATRYETQAAVFEYGSKNKLWATDAAIVANGEGFADALSVSPVAFKLKAPVFYANRSGALSDAQRKQVESTSFGRYLVVGGNAVVSDSVVSWLGGRAQTKRLGGATRYETSLEIARYATSNCGMNWDGMAFTSGKAPYDALGGAVLQGSRGSVLVLKDPGDSTGACVPSGAHPSTYRYFGGMAIYPSGFKVLMAKKSGYDVSQIDGVSCSVSGNWYTIDGSRYLWSGSDWTYGMKYADGSWRYFDSSTGAMATGWVYVNGQYYEFDNAGVWVKIHYHNIEWAGQPNNYYCGPTSGYMVLRNVGAWTSASGDGLNIWNVARYMHTDAYGYTSFQDRWFMRGMNNWLGRDVYTSVHTPSYETVRNAIMASYVNGYATVVDEQERRGGPHFNGHNNGTFAHLMVVDGYNQEGDEVYICDPGAEVLWPSGSHHFWYGSLRDFVQTYMQNEINGSRERIGVHFARY